jgi:hypothetical protein
VHVDRWSGRLKTIDVQKRINYLRRKFGRWRKRRRDKNRRRRRIGNRRRRRIRNRRRRRIRDRRRMRGRGGLRWRRRSMHNRRSWKRQDKVKGRLWSWRTVEKRWKNSHKAQTKK